MVSSRSKTIISFIVVSIGFSIGLCLAFTDGLRAYDMGYAILIGFFIFNASIDIILSIPTMGKAPNPSTDLSRYLAKTEKGKQPVFIKKIKERAF